MVPPLTAGSMIVDECVRRIAHEVALLSVLTRERWLLDYHTTAVLQWASREIGNCILQSDEVVPPPNPFPYPIPPES